MAFRVGQKVVCVDKSCGFINMLGEEFDDPLLVLGAVYTIRSIVSHEGGEGGSGVELEEIRERQAPKGKKASNAGISTFGAWRFRPLVERKTDISVFTKMLTDTNIRADA